MSALACDAVEMLSEAVHFAPLDEGGADLMAALAQGMVRGGLVSIVDAAWACALWAQRGTPDVDVVETAVRLAGVLLGRPTGMAAIFGAGPQAELQ